MTTMPIYALTDTWNAAGTTFAGIQLNVTDTASAAGSLLIDLQVGGSSRFKVQKDGRVTIGNSEGLILSNLWLFGNHINLDSSSSVRWGSTSDPFGTIDTILARDAAATFRLGAPSAASPVAQTLLAQGSRAGTDSNVGGGNLTIQPGNGTGTGTLSTLILRSPVAVASGTGAQTQTTGLTIRAGTAVMTSYTVATLPAANIAGAGARAFVTDALNPVFGSAAAGGGAVNVPVYSDGSTWNVG